MRTKVYFRSEISQWLKILCNNYYGFEFFTVFSFLAGINFKTVPLMQYLLSVGVSNPSAENMSKVTITYCTQNFGPGIP